MRHEATGGLAIPRDAVETLAVDAGGAWLVATPRVGAAANGAGDVLAALFLGHTLRGEDTAQALARAVSSVHAVLVLPFTIPWCGGRRSGAIRSGARPAVMLEHHKGRATPPVASERRPQG